MQIVHATFRAGEGEEAVKLLDTLGIDIEDYKLIESKSGDLLIINLLYGNMDILIDNLSSKFDFENDKERSLVIFTPDTVIPRDKDKLKTASYLSTRESLITFAQNNSRVNTEYMMLVIASSVVTSLGLILDNIAVIVGGMVIAPVLGPILAITIGIVLGKPRLIKQGISAELIGIVFAVLVGFIWGSFIPDVGLTNSLRIRMYPTLADLFIAVAAGSAAAYSLIKRQLRTGLVGVMVAASLLPVMCTIGIGISFANPEMIKGASLLLGGNYLGLLLANVIVFYIKGLRPQTWYQFKAEKIIKKSLIILIVSILLLSIPLGFMTVLQFFREKPVEIIKATIRENLVLEWDYHIESVEIKGNLINIYMYAEKKVDEERLYSIKDRLQAELEQEYNINFKVIPVREYNI